MIYCWKFSNFESNEIWDFFCKIGLKTVLSYRNLTGICGVKHKSNDMDMNNGAGQQNTGAFVLRIMDRWGKPNQKTYLKALWNWY